MYEQHWQLQTRPFDDGADVRFYFPAESHQAALLKLRYAVENRRTAALLAGPCGVGKTLLLAMLRKALPERFAPVAHLVFPQMPAEDLLAYVAGELTGNTPGSAAPVAQTVHVIERFLVDNASRGRQAVVAVDEAHLIDDIRCWEALRLLLNCEYEGRPALTLLVIGKTGLLAMLERLHAMEERLAVKCLLRAFDRRETAHYVEHRLKAAGTSERIFGEAALDRLHELTHGIPRRINRLCDLALLVAFAEEQHEVTANHLESVHGELVAVSA